jgi:ribosomal protein L10e
VAQRQAITFYLQVIDMPRPTKCYKDVKQPFTRKQYIKRIPNVPEGLKKMTYGNTKKLDFPAKMSLVALLDGQVSDKALDSIRVTINRELKILEESNYRLQINSYPHHICRMHGLIGVAKAERIAKGMKQSFGQSQYRLAQIRKGHEIIVVLLNNDAISFGLCRKALNLATNKLPLKWRIVYEGFPAESIIANVVLPKRHRESKKEKEIVREPKTQR